MRAAFDHEGDIRGVDLLGALVALWREGASGSLQFSRAGATAGFEVVAGEIVATSSSDPRFETAAILVRAGKLDARTLERLAAPEGADRALLALQAGVLTRREWRWGEKIRAVEILSDLLTWLEGEYWFLRTNEDGRETTEPRLPIPRLVLELFLRSRDRSLVLKHLGGADVPLARAPSFDAEFATFGLTADAESVVRLIDGTSTAEQIASEAPAEAFAVEKLLAALVTLGLVHPEFGAGGRATRAADATDGELAAPHEAPAQAVAEAAAGDEEEWKSGDEGEAEDGDEPSDDALEAGEEEPETDDESASDIEEVEIHAVEEELRASSVDEGPSELGDDAGWRRDLGSALDEAAPGARAIPADLELAALRSDDAAGGDRPREIEIGGSADAFGRPLDSATGVGELERPKPRGLSPLVWVLAALGLALVVTLWLRSRGPSPPPTESGAAVPSPAAETPAVAAPEPTAAATVAPLPAAEAPAALPAALPTTAPTPVPTAPPPRGKPTPRPAVAKGPAAPPSAAGSPREASSSRQHWLERAARDAQKLAADRKTHYAIQLELACEVQSLTDAFQHDRPPGSMWLLATPHQDRTCFRVLWGHYPTIEAARRGLSGTPRFFSTPKNRPAVTGVR